MESRVQAQSPELRRCVHGRLIENHFLNSADTTDLFSGNIFLKQHVKKCASCKKVIESGVFFWNSKKNVLENRMLAPRQRELFLSEIDQLFSEFDLQIASIDETSPSEKLRKYFYKLSGELLSPGMLTVYSLIAFSSLALYLLI